RPLRPATRRRLGRPSPHQQADRPRAHPRPKNFPPPPMPARVISGISPRFRGLSQVQGRLLTCYSPVRRSSTPEEAFPLDLHVLSTPPAFVLSQDQTLQQKPESDLTNRQNTQTKTSTGYKQAPCCVLKQPTHTATVCPNVDNPSPGQLPY